MPKTSKIKWEPGMVPEGQDLMDCINSEIPICHECGAIMRRYADSMGGCDIFECDICGFSIDDMDYEYHDPDDDSIESSTYGYDEW